MTMEGDDPYPKQDFSRILYFLSDYPCFHAGFFVSAAFLSRRLRWTSDTLLLTCILRFGLIGTGRGKQSHDGQKTYYYELFHFPVSFPFFSAYISIILPWQFCLVNTNKKGCSTAVFALMLQPDDILRSEKIIVFSAVQQYEGPARKYQCRKYQQHPYSVILPARIR